MNATIIFLLILFLNSSIGLFVYVKNPHQTINKTFGLLALFISLWVTANFLVDEISNLPIALLFTRIDFFLGIIVVFLIFIFSITFVHYNLNKIYRIILFSFIAILALIALSTNFIVQDVKFIEYGYDIAFGKLEILYDFFVFGLILFSIIILVSNYRISKGLEKSRILFVLLGLILTTVITAIANLLLPYLFPANPIITRIGLFSLVLFIIFTSYSILAHRLFDIRVIIKRTLVYSVLLAFVLAVYAGVIFIFAQIFGGETANLSIKAVIPNIIAALFIAIGFGPLQKWLSQVTDRFLFKGEYNTEDTLSELSKILSAVLDLDEALQAINTILVQEMRLHGATAFVLTKDPESEDTIVKSSQTIGYDENKTLNSKSETLNKSQITNPKSQTNSNDQNKEIPRQARNDNNGNHKITLQPHDGLIEYYQNYINSQIGDHGHSGERNETRIDSGQARMTSSRNSRFHGTDSKKGNIPNLSNGLKEEIKITAEPVVTEELARKTEELSGQNIFKNTVAELKKINGAVALPIIIKTHLVGLFVLGDKKSGDIYTDRDLQFLQVVANQTGAAIEKARFYEEDQLKSEFVSIASHELLTPTSAIEGYLSMILDEGMGKIDAQTKGYLEKVYSSSKRLAHLVKDLLNVSRIEGGRIVVQSKNFDIVELVKTVIEEITPKAKEKGLELKTQGLDREVPEMWADPERVHQVLVNLIGNSIKYSDKGTITVAVDFSMSVVRISVIDTGVGIPEDEIPHLFEKFYRASNADTTGAQGTGLGLYISKQIVELMGGIMQVDSEIGKGSTFSFSLPRAKECSKYSV